MICNVKMSSQNIKSRYAVCCTIFKTIKSDFNNLGLQFADNIRSLVSNFSLAAYKPYVTRIKRGFKCENIQNADVATNKKVTSLKSS